MSEQTICGHSIDYIATRNDGEQICTLCVLNDVEAIISEREEFKRQRDIVTQMLWLEYKENPRMDEDGRFLDEMTTGEFAKLIQNAAGFIPEVQ